MREKRKIRINLLPAEQRNFELVYGEKGKIANCSTCNIEFVVLHRGNKYCSKKCSDIGKSKNISLKLKGHGGVREGSGWGKSGWYKGFRCDSTWELAWIIYNLDHNIKFTRNNEKFEYVFNDEIKHYVPDFIMEDGVYIEIKGYLTASVMEKSKQFPHKLIMLQKKDMQVYLNYVKEKYGANFIEMYENNPHKIKKNKCKICGKPAKKLLCSRQCAIINATRNHNMLRSPKLE